MEILYRGILISLYETGRGYDYSVQEECRGDEWAFRIADALKILRGFEWF